MTSDNAVVRVLEHLNALNIPFMVVGSLASNFYGIPRATRDADLVMACSPGELDALAIRLGPTFALDAQSSFETVTGTLRRVLHVIGSAFVFELFSLSEDPHDRARFARRVQVTILGHRAWVPTAEDVVITKLRWAVHGRRAKDADDARNVLALRGEDLDWPYIDRWCETHGTAEDLHRLRQSLPPT